MKKQLFTSQANTLASSLDEADDVGKLLEFFMYTCL